MCVKTNVFKVFSKTLLFLSLILIGFSANAQTKMFDVEFKDCKVYIKQTNSKEIWSIKPVNGFWYDGNPTTPTFNFASGNTSRSIMYNQFNSVKFEGVVYAVTSAPTLADTIKNYLKFCKDLSSSAVQDTSANAILRAIKDSIAQTNTAIRLQDSTTQSRQLVKLEPLNETIEHIQLTASGTDNNAVNTLRGIGITGSFDAKYDVSINGSSVSYDVANGLQFADYNVDNGTINDTIDITCTTGTIIISKLK